jgi:hypothetical protein
MDRDHVLPAPVTDQDWEAQQDIARTFSTWVGDVQERGCYIKRAEIRNEVACGDRAAGVPPQATGGVTFEVQVQYSSENSEVSVK